MCSLHIQTLFTRNEANDYIDVRRLFVFCSIQQTLNFVAKWLIPGRNVRWRRWRWSLNEPRNKNHISPPKTTCHLYTVESVYKSVSLYSIPFSFYSILVSKWVNFCLGKHDLNCAQQQYNEYWMVDVLHSVADWLVWVPWQSRRRCATHWPRSTGTEDETTINVELDGCQFTKLRYRWCRQLVDINQRCLSWVLRLSIKFLDKNVLDMFISSVYVVAFKNLAVNMHVTLQLVSTWKHRSTYIWMNKWWIWSGSSVMLIGPQNDSNARPANKFQATTISPSSSSF